MSVAVERLSPAGLAAETERLAELLHACVHGGAAVSFIVPFPLEAARAYWRDSVAPEVGSGTSRVLVARVDGETLGTVRLDLVTTANQPHRAAVAKLLVHPQARRRGLGRALMLGVEAEARACGRSLLTLDCRAGGEAERLYASVEYRSIGVIPAYSRHPSEDTWDACAFMYKALA